MAFANRPPTSRQPASRRSARRRPLPHSVEASEEPTAEVRAEQAAKAEAIERKILVRRLRLLAIGFVFFVAIVLAQMVVVKTINSASQTNRANTKPVDTSRGRIVDRDGTLLATDTFHLGSVARPEPVQAREVLGRHGGPGRTGTGDRAGVIMEALGQKGVAVQLIKNATSQQCDRATKSQLVPSWFWCDAKRKRSYPQGPLGAHLVGFADANQDGPVWRGAVLRRLAAQRRQAGARPQLSGPGEPIPHEWELYLPSVSGRDLVLNLSAPLQHLVEQDLVDALAKYQAQSGSIIIMDPRTGGDPGPGQLAVL